MSKKHRCKAAFLLPSNIRKILNTQQTEIYSFRQNFLKNRENSSMVTQPFV